MPEPSIKQVINDLIRTVEDLHSYIDKFEYPQCLNSDTTQLKATPTVLKDIAKALEKLSPFLDAPTNLPEGVEFLVDEESSWRGVLEHFQSKCAAYRKKLPCGTCSFGDSILWAGMAVEPSEIEGFRRRAEIIRSLIQSRADKVLRLNSDDLTEETPSPHDPVDATIWEKIVDDVYADKSSAASMAGYRLFVEISSETQGKEDVVKSLETELESGLAAQKSTRKSTTGSTPTFDSAESDDDPILFRGSGTMLQFSALGGNIVLHRI